MCWDVMINGEVLGTRDSLEAATGESTDAFNKGILSQDERGDDHCLCPIDVADYLISCGYWVREARGDESFDLAYVAVDSMPEKESAQS